MPRFVAFLRGVSPMNAKMPELKRVFEGAGFTDVKTVLSSGNVVFTAARARSNAALAGRAEEAMAEHLGRTFFTIVRSTAALNELIESDPFAAFKLPANAKRVVTFLPEGPHARPKLPIETDGARIMANTGQEILTAYVPSARGAVFMALIEKTFGRDVTTRTWDTVKKCAALGTW